MILGYAPQGQTYARPHCLQAKVHYAFHQYRMIGYRYLSEINIPFKIYNKSSSDKRKDRLVPEHSERNVSYHEKKIFSYVFVVQYCSGRMQQPFGQ